MAPLGKLHVKGSTDVSQLIIDANATQSNTKPLILLRKSGGSNLLSITADDSTNCFVGLKAGKSNDASASALNNTFIGNQAGFLNVTGHDNTAVGSQAMYSNTRLSQNTAIGKGALGTQSYDPGFDYSSGNVAVGNAALLTNNPTNPVNGVGNSAVGWSALRFNTIGANNSAFGFGSLYTNTTGSKNIAVGMDAMRLNTTGGSNTVVGANALYNNVGGSSNTAIGNNAGYGDVGINFTQCTFLGESATLAVTRTNVTLLGYGIFNAQCTADHQVLLGNTAVGQIRAQVTGITAYSDARFKTNIKENVRGLDFILKLNPVTYNVRPVELHKIWGTPDSLVNKIDHSQIEQQIQIGFLAQDVEQAALESGFNFPGIDVPRNAKEVYSLRYVDFIMPMVKSIQELAQQNELLAENNKQQDIIIENLMKRIEKLEKKEIKKLLCFRIKFF